MVWGKPHSTRIPWVQHIFGVIWLLIKFPLTYTRGENYARRKYWEHRLDLETAKYFKGIKRQKNAKNVLEIATPRLSEQEKQWALPSGPYQHPVTGTAGQAPLGGLQDRKNSLDHAASEKSFSMALFRVETWFKKEGLSSQVVWNVSPIKHNASSLF